MLTSRQGRSVAFSWQNNECPGTVYPKKYAHDFCFAVLCCGYTLTDFPYPSGLLHWHCGNLTIAPVPAKQPWWIWINTPCEFILNDCITTTKQSTTKPYAYFLGYTVIFCILSLKVYTYLKFFPQLPARGQCVNLVCWISLKHVNFHAVWIQLIPYKSLSDNWLLFYTYC